MDTDAIESAIRATTRFRELDAVIDEMRQNDAVLIAAIERKYLYNRLKREQERWITDRLNAPYHDEAKRWKQGDKVYFGKADNRSAFYFDEGIKRLYNIKAGQWCRVWRYHPRSKYAWLCKPGKACKYENIIDHAFTIDDIRTAQISRTEPSIRPEGWRS